MVDHKKTLEPLLVSIVSDNPTYNFPHQAISKEMIGLFLDRREFDYFMMQAYKRLKSDYGFAVAHIFLSTLELKLDLQNRDIHTITDIEYQQGIENVLTTLEQLKFTKVDKNSPDGEMLSAMI